MKYMTFVVPCYNSQAYLRRCLDSLVRGGQEVEVIVIDDGSTDQTGRIADEYAESYPGIVRAVHQENGGHGAGVNRGLALAEGIYFKVVDSDDWLEEGAYRKLLEKVKAACDGGKPDQMPDLFVCNYVYDHLEAGSRRMDYRNVFPAGRLCGWEETGRFRPSQYLIMHALIYRLQVLKDSGVSLPHHMFYVDNIFAYQPLIWVKRICYLDLDLYHYYIGRADQSVNESVLMSRIDQQIAVTKIVAGCVDLRQVEQEVPKLAAYLRRNISIMMAISSIHLRLMRSREADLKRKSLWRGVKAEDRRLYYRLKFGTVSGLTDLPGRLGGELSIGGYRLARKIYQFQ